MNPRALFGKKGPAGEPEDPALGRSQGGFGTKLSLVCDGAGTPIAVAVGPGQKHETQQAIPLSEEALAWPEQPAKVAGDKGYSAGWLRAQSITPRRNLLLPRATRARPSSTRCRLPSIVKSPHDSFFPYVARPTAVTLAHHLPAGRLSAGARA